MSLPADPAPTALSPPYRFRSALKLSKLNAGYSICTLSDDLLSLHVNCYSQTLCKIVYHEQVEENTLGKVTEEVRKFRGSEVKEERSKFFTELLNVWLEEKEPLEHQPLQTEKDSEKDSTTTTEPEPEPSPPLPPQAVRPPTPPSKSRLTECEETLALAHSHFSSSNYASCIDSCLYAVKLHRSTSETTSTLSSISTAYSLMGDAYVALGEKKFGRAISCYTLSLKNSDKLEVRTKLTKLKTNEKGEEASIEEIESLVKSHKVMGVEDRFKFNCTGCGECCRTADNILLTPYDLFNMTR